MHVSWSLCPPDWRKTLCVLDFQPTLLWFFHQPPQFHSTSIVQGMMGAVVSCITGLYWCFFFLGETLSWASFGAKIQWKRPVNTTEAKWLCCWNAVSSLCLQSVVFLLLVLQPVGFVTFDSRSGAEAAKNALNVSTAVFSWFFPPSSLLQLFVFPFV